ncbi:MAG: hypothetical protein IV100_30590 [Myxococcales bacterium]|nr:hypothetical protein [Myxococcales bacterium]
MTHSLVSCLGALAVAAASIPSASADEPAPAEKSGPVTKKSAAEDALEGHIPRKKTADTKEKLPDEKKQINGEKKE